MKNKYYQIDSEYEDLKNASYYWDVAKGLQEVDKLKTSDKLEELINEHVSGAKNYNQIEQEIKQYHAENGNSSYREDEADVVATRIAKLLNVKDFRLTKQELLRTHGFLFDGLFDDDLDLRDTQGKFRTVNIAKDEDILNGKSVVYTDYHNIEEYLDYDLQEERVRIRTQRVDDIAQLSKFVSNIWNTHPFREGNTRTIAVFTIRYLRENGINVTNDLFKNNSLYFRNALVLASDNQSDIDTTYEYLQCFFSKLLIDEKIELKKMEV